MDEYKILKDWEKRDRRELKELDKYSYSGLDTSKPLKDAIIIAQRFMSRYDTLSKSHDELEEEVRELKRENRQLASIENDVHNEDQYYPTEDMIAEDRGPPDDKDGDG